MAGKKESDLLCQISPPCGNGKEKILCLPLGDNSSFIVTSQGANISIVSPEGNVVHLEFPSDVTDWLPKEDRSNGFDIWTSTADGSVYLTHDVEKVAKSAAEDNGNESGENIFDDLLDETRENSVEPVTTMKLETNQSVLKISTSIQCLLHIEDVLVVLSAVQDSGYLLGLYTLERLTSHTNKAQCLHSDGHKGEVFLPDPEETHRKQTSPPFPVMCCLSVDDGDAVVTDSLPVTKQLYNDLYAVHFNHLDSSIILVGLPNGHVYATPLKSTTEGPKLIYNLEEAVVAIFPVCFEEEMSELQIVISRGVSNRGNNCLLMVGSGGKIAYIFRDSHKTELVFKEVFVPSQIVCCCLVQSTLLLGTRTELQVIRMAEIQKASNLQYVQCNGLKLFNVRALSVGPAEVGNHVYAITRWGQVLQKQVNFENLASLEVRTGESDLKDLLTSIGYVSENLKATQTVVTEANKVLEQLTIAGVIASQIYGGSGKTARGSLPVRAEVLVHRSDLGSAVKYVLVVRVQNCGQVTLGDNWSVIVNVASDLAEDVHRADGTFLPYNAVLVQPCHRGLCSPGGFQELHHELPANIASRLPLSVSVLLSYDVSFLVSGNMNTETFAEQQVKDVKCITFPVFRRNIDILHFVRPVTSQVGSERPVSLETILPKLATQRSAAWKQQDKSNINDDTTERRNQYSTSIHVTESAAAQLCGGGIASDVGILQTLLQSSLPATEVTQSMTRLVAADGSQVLLTVERSSESEKTRSGFDVHVQCPTVFLLSQLRSAVCAKIGRNESNVSCTTKEARIVLQQIKAIQSELQCLQDAIAERSHPVDQIISQAVQLWLKLRNIRFPD